ncbi:MAG TPA: hypothetical protein VMB51_16590 [Solirubrobacteraceae bacterium]|nr:hypothetical protein [Solirubrobacteraceae bacterium]
MTSIHADQPQEAYELSRRYTSKRGQKPLKGFALDLTVRFNSDGVPFLQDHNGDLGTMPFHNVDEFTDWLAYKIRQNHDEHFRSAAA